MGSFFGYIGSVIGVVLWISCLLGVVVMVIFGLIHYTRRQTIEDPGEGDPEVLSGAAPPLNKGEMSPFEATAVKASLPMLIAAMLGVATVLGFSAYGLKEMAAGTKTTAKMRQEAKDQAAATKKAHYGGSAPGIDEDEGPTKKKRTKAFDITTTGSDAKPKKKEKEKEKEKKKKKK